jgi:hypothetical protein
MNTAAPKGYKPFYVSHYGRHGSRYLLGDNDYRWVMNQLQDADKHHALTALGQDVLSRLNQVWEEAEGRGGELTPLGQRQHHDIAQRMFKAYPEAFDNEATVTAASTVVMRCAHSMFAFIEGLKELNPNLKIPRESGTRNMYYLNYHTMESGKYNSQQAEWYPDYCKFKEEKTQPDRMIQSLFSDSLYIRRHIHPSDFMWGMYWITVDMQNMETPVSFTDLWKGDELFNLWEVFNYNFYACNASYPLADGQHVDNAKNLLRNIMDTAEEYIAGHKHGATLRFGHDGNVIPLAALLQFKDCAVYEDNPYELYKVYSDFKVSPMASNIQLVFFKNKSDDVIVKFMLNEREVAIPAETDIYPFYRWDVAKQALLKILDTPCREYLPAKYRK